MVVGMSAPSVRSMASLGWGWSGWVQPASRLSGPHLGGSMTSAGRAGHSSMMSTTFDLAPQAAEVARVVAAVRDDQLGAPTPCAGTSVAALLDHLHGLSVGMRMAAEKTPVDSPPTASADALPTDWRVRIPEELAALVASWQQPSAWEGTTRAGGVVLPAAVMGVVALNEVLVHGWDLAVATGRPYAVDDGSAQRCLDHAVWFAEAVPDGRDQIYGPVVPVPGSAPVLDRLLGLTGRDPGWTPSP
jgi:uncharacterized protein (TIGR03086 family)